MKENIVKQIEINNNIRKLKINIKIYSINISGSVIISMLGTNIFSNYNYDNKLLPIYATSIGVLSLFTLGNILLIYHREKMIERFNNELFQLQDDTLEYQKRINIY